MEKLWVGESLHYTQIEQGKKRKENRKTLIIELNFSIALAMELYI